MVKHILISLLCLHFAGELALAQEYFPAGSEAKSVGIGSALHCRGASCLPYNPAAMNSKGIEPYVEVGMVQVKQTYEHRNFDPVRIQVNSPYATLGLSHQIAESGFSYGLYVVPLGFGEQKINGLPRRIAGNFESLYIRNKSTAYDVLLGTRYAPNDVVAFGFSLIRREEKRKIFATRVGEEAALIRYDGHNTFYIPMLGMTLKPADWLEIGAAYRFPRQKSYKGRQKAASSDQITSPTNTNYDPAIIFSSVKVRVHPMWSLLVNVNRHFYARGSNKFREGLTSDVARADLQDIDERSFSVLWSADEKWTATLSAAIAPTPWGPGKYSDNPDIHTSGADFGGANNVTRRILAAGLTHHLAEQSNVNVSAFFGEGKREIGPIGDRPGYYEQRSIGLTLGLRHAF